MSRKETIAVSCLIGEILLQTKLLRVDRQNQACSIQLHLLLYMYLGNVLKYVTKQFYCT